LDGAHDRTALRDVLAGFVISGDLDVEEEGQPVREAIKIPELAEKMVEQHLPEIARHALLVG
jgi:hypothetical protein